MKKQIMLLFIFTCFIVVNNAQAMLIQGNFSGSIDINGHLNELSNGDLFSGQFIYDTAAVSDYDSTSGGTSFSHVPNALVSLSLDLTGSGGGYNYTNTGAHAGDVQYTNTGDYTLDFDGLPGKENFISDLDLQWAEMILDFNNTYVTDPATPLFMPNEADFVQGNSYGGSVFYMWVADNQGINPGNAQINANISSMSLKEYSQPIPEPATIILVLGGFLSLAVVRKSRQQQNG
jgi:hypothetical protein